MMAEEKKNTIDKPLWGWEEIIVNNELYCLKMLNIYEGHWFSLQYHESKQETHYVFQGKVLMQKGNDGKALSEDSLDEFILTPGERAITIPSYTAHRCGSLEGTSLIIEVSTKHVDSDTKRLEETVEGITNKIPQELMEKHNY